jgi:hypothetical protein
MKKVIWFSRHDMTQHQLEALTSKVGECEIVKINGTAPNVHVPFEAEVNGVSTTSAPLKQLVTECDIFAGVLPINLQQQILPFLGDVPYIFAVNNRERNPDGEFQFVFQKWQRLLNVEIVVEDF